LGGERLGAWDKDMSLVCAQAAGEKALLHCERELWGPT
jgi:hypothetical protein